MLEWALFVWDVRGGGVQEVVQVPAVPRDRGRAAATGRAAAVGVGFALLYNFFYLKYNDMTVSLKMSRFYICPKICYILH